MGDSAAVNECDNGRQDREEQLADRDHRPSGVSRGNADAISDRVCDHQHLDLRIDLVGNRQGRDQPKDEGIAPGAGFIEQFELPGGVLIGAAEEIDRRRHAQNRDDCQQQTGLGNGRGIGNQRGGETRADPAQRPDREARGMGIERRNQSLADPVVERIRAEQHLQQ